MSNFWKRALSGLVFVVVVIGATLLSRYSFAVVFGAIMLLCLNEYYQLAHKADSQPQKAMGIGIGTLIFIWSYCRASNIIPETTGYIIVLLIITVFIIELFRSSQHPLQNIASTLLGVLYVSIPMSILNFIVLPGNNYTPIYLLGMLFLVWGNDTGAYLFGVSLGKHRMFPRISPKKSWEGFIGGVLFTGIVSYLLSFTNCNATWLQWLILGAIACVFAVFGDLVESMFKRAAGVKDSGRFMPGHGGALDRFDALLMVSPTFFITLKLLNLI